ncbi:MAG: Spi family protease inhibitor, partial [Bacteroidaceae bacterium]|nr:Spi family protease inhibitor [Bacteroidaceae bacterium]
MMTFTIYRFRVYNWLRGALLLIAMLFVTNSLQADDVSVDEALRIAGQFADSPQTRKLSKQKAPARKAEPTLAHAMRSKVASEKDNVYVINLGNEQGFVVVSGETGTEDEVLGYCDHGSFSYNDCPV